jgi:hypothetical protein
MPTGCLERNDPLFKLTMLPARQGDCLWITYGASTAHHLIIDGGPEKGNSLRSAILAQIDAAPDRRLHIDLLVATHIDNDHIGGILDVILDMPTGLTISDVWFNGYRHLPPSDLLGPDQAERLTEALDRKQIPWNVAFDRGPVMIPEAGSLPSRLREDGLKITLLGPNRAQLVRLGSVWKSAVRESEMREPKSDEEDLLGRHDVWPPDIRELARKPFQSDTGPANGSSITLLIQYEGKQILLAADAHAPALANALDRIESNGQRLELQAFKLSHHGSRKSTSTELLNRVACNRYLISSNGSYFGHPDTEAIARVIVHGGRNPSLLFNYDTEYCSRWRDKPILNAPKFLTRFPARGAHGFELDL